MSSMQLRVVDCMNWKQEGGRERKRSLCYAFLRQNGMENLLWPEQNGWHTQLIMCQVHTTITTQISFSADTDNLMVLKGMTWYMAAIIRMGPPEYSIHIQHVVLVDVLRKYIQVYSIISVHYAGEHGNCKICRTPRCRSGWVTCLTQCCPTCCPRQPRMWPNTKS